MKNLYKTLMPPVLFTALFASCIDQPDTLQINSYMGRNLGTNSSVLLERGRKNFEKADDYAKLADGPGSEYWDSCAVFTQKGYEDLSSITERVKNGYVGLEKVTENQWPALLHNARHATSLMIHQKLDPLFNYAFANHSDFGSLNFQVLNENDSTNYLMLDVENVYFMKQDYPNANVTLSGYINLKPLFQNKKIDTFQEDVHIIDLMEVPVYYFENDGSLIELE